MTDNKANFMKLVSDEKTDTIERAKERIAKAKIQKNKAFFKNIKL